MRVAIVGTNNAGSYSGGRYHALILGYAMARAGIEVTIVTNARPVFAADLEPLAPNRVGYAITPDFAANMPQGVFDFVIVVPTGIFQPDFYRNAIAFAHRAEARLGLINFESANWFNAMSPQPKDPLLWDNWRRVVALGGLVLSSAAESERHAKQFYRSRRGTLRFEVCPPPINSPVADRMSTATKNGSVLAFVRPSDAHKGGRDLLSLDAALFSGRELHVVSGGGFDPEFQAALERKFGASLRMHSSVSDEQKFRLMAAAQALLFPSHFEGFGYPPAEAAYVGTEVVCYDLPVLRETVGPIAHMAPMGDATALGEKLRQALSMPDRRAELRAAVERRVGIDASALRIADILLRSHEAVAPVATGADGASWGPWPEEAGEPPSSLPASYPPLPPHLASLVRTRAGDFLATFVFCARHMPARFVAAAPEFTPADPHFRVLAMSGDWIVVAATCTLQPACLGQRIELEAVTADGAGVAQLSFAFDEVQPAEDGAVAIGEADDALEATLTRLTDATEAALTLDGVSWIRVPVRDGSSLLRVSRTAAEENGVTLYVYRGDSAVAVFGGYPPQAAARRAGSFARQASRLSVSNLTDADWHNGISRRPVEAMLGVVRCTMQPGSFAPKPGLIARLGSGRIARVADVRRADDALYLMFETALDPARDGYPHEIEIVDSGEPAVASDWFLGDAKAEQDSLLVSARLRGRFGEGAVLRFAGGEERQVTRIADFGFSLAVTLDAPLYNSASRNSAPDILDPDGKHPQYMRLAQGTGPGWQRGVQTAGPLANHIVRVGGTASVAEGDALVFAASGLRRVVAVRRQPDGIDVTLDAAVDPARDGAPRELRFATVLERAGRGASALVHPSAVPLKMPMVQAFTDAYRRTGTARGDASSLYAERPRVLFASIVPPIPMDQGNRVVTRNFIGHLVGAGFDVDLLLLGSVKYGAMAAEYGDRVRTFAVPFPDWPAEPSAALRRRLLDELDETPFAGAEREIARAMRLSAVSYHPFFIVPDAMADLAKALYATHAYHSIVCNYAHMLRIAKELEAIRPLPPVAVITHDALSRLATEHEGRSLDTMYRYCSAEVERDVLNSVAGAQVLAISKSEQKYFRSIGVKNQVLLCEFDALAESRRYRATPASFESKTLVFHASANPMNIAAIDWFIERCLPDIAARVPEARLVVCGRINEAWSSAAPNVMTRGNISRADLMAVLQRATVAINPVAVGTGLKIKTVEAACAGVPSVGTPASVEGLEDGAKKFAIVAADEGAFTAACVRLLTDRAAWETLYKSALDYTAARFSEAAIYGDVDARMGWNRNVEARRQLTRTPYRIHARVPDAERALDEGDIAQTLGHAAAALAEAPAEIGAYAAMIAAFAALRADADVSVAAREAALAAPLSPDLPALLSGVRERVLDVAELAAEPALALAPGEAVAIADIAAPGTRLGVGWSGVEEWGAWSNGRYARLNLIVPESADALRLSLTLHAIPGGTEPMQSFLLYADGVYAGRHQLERKPQQKVFDIALPLPAAPRERVVLEFYIADPAPVMKKGEVVDSRLLGIALHRIGVAPVVAAARRPVKAG